MFPVVAAVAAVAVSAVGCGSGDDESGDPTSTEAWAGDVCSSVSTWEDVVTQAGSTLRDRKNLSVNGFEDAVGSVVDATSALVTEVSALGPPDTDAGDDAQAVLETLAGSLEAEAAVLSDALDANADTIAELLTSASTVTGSLSTMVADVETALNDLDTLGGAAELKDAFASVESCQQVSSAD